MIEAKKKAGGGGRWRWVGWWRDSLLSPCRPAACHALAAAASHRPARLSHTPLQELALLRVRDGLPAAESGSEGEDE